MVSVEPDANDTIGEKEEVAVPTLMHDRDSMVGIAEDNDEDGASSDDECNEFVEAPERMTEISTAERPTADFSDRPTSLAMTEIRYTATVAYIQYFFMYTLL